MFFPIKERRLVLRSDGTYIEHARLADAEAVAKVADHIAYKTALNTKFKVSLETACTFRPMRAWEVHSHDVTHGGIAVHWEQARAIMYDGVPIGGIDELPF